MRHPQQLLRRVPPAQHWLAALLTCVMAFTLIAATPSLASAQTNDEVGVLIVRVLADSPAADAGLSRGDIVLSVDGEAVNSAAELMQAVAAHAAGDEIELVLMHGSEEVTATAVLEAVDGRVLLGVQPYQEMAQVRIQRGMDDERSPRAEQPDTDEPESAMPDAMPELRWQEIEAGALVVDVLADGPADAAGLQPGDIVSAVDGEAVPDAETLVEMIGGYAPDEIVTLTVQREGEELSIEATLAARDDDAERGFLGVQIAPVIPAMQGESMRPFEFNMPFERGSGAVWMMDGVMVRDVAEDSPAAAAGLEPGDWITEVNGEAVTDFDGLRALIEAAQPGDEMELTVQSGGMPMFHRGAQDTEAESRTVIVTLGENEAGGAFLGISVMPMRIQMHDMTPSVPGSSDDKSSSGEDQGSMMPFHFFFHGMPNMPNLPFFHGMPNEDGVDLYFHGAPNGDSAPSEVAPTIPSQQL
ncbi:MAG: PDZ domain-containing protein [Caldilineaceae bacterium]